MCCGCLAAYKVFVGLFETEVVLVLELVLLVDGPFVFRKVAVRVVDDLVISRDVVRGVFF